MQRDEKYIRLFGTLFFTFIGFIISLVLVLLLLRLTFGLLDHVPWFSLVFMVFIICVPAALFIPVYIIYFKRTKSHASKIVRWISYIFFMAMLAAWVLFLVQDLFLFYQHLYNAVGEYMSYNMFFLAANVFCIFFIGIIQALSSPKEEGWYERSLNKNEGTEVENPD